jgi:hypothetical protein
VREFECLPSPRPTEATQTSPPTLYHMPTAAALRALVVRYLRPELLIAKITQVWQAPPCPPRWHTRRKARSKTDSPYTRVDEHWSACGYDRGRGQRVREEEHGEGREDEQDVRRRRKRWCTHVVKRNSHCAGWCRTNTGRRRLLPRPLPRMGWRRGGGMQGERKEAG